MEAYPGIYVHSIQIGKNEKEDRLASVYDNLNRQVDEICAQLGENKALQGGFDAVGFSQGGQILRAYVQRCNDPPVRNLITIGAQHQGVMDLPGCAQHGKELEINRRLAQVSIPPHHALGGVQSGECSWWQRMLKKSVYSDFAQEHIVQAQYFKDPARAGEYLAKNTFLVDLNNEGSVKKPEYAERLSSLKNFVMYMFTQDTQVVPAQSSIFGYFDGKQLQALKEQPIYQEDWIGLKALDEQGRLHQLSIEAEHMHVSPAFVIAELVPWLGDGGAA